MQPIHKILTICCLLSSSLQAGEKSEKYHKALQRSPLSEQLFTKFHQAWEIDGDEITLAEYLKKVASESWQDRVIYARFLVRLNQRQEAMKYLALAIKDQPENMLIYQFRSQLSIDELDFEKASKDLELVVNKSEGELLFKAQESLGKCYIRMGRVDDALKIWKQVIEEKKEGIEFIEVSEAEGQMQQAVELCEILIRLTKDPYKNLRYTIKLGSLKSKEGKSDEALEILTKALAKTGVNSWVEREILQECDVILHRKGDSKSEREFYAKLEKAYPNRASIIKKYAVLLAFNDQWDESTNRYIQLIKTNPGDLVLREDYIHFLESYGKKKEALTEINQLISITGYSEPLLLRKISLLADLELKDEIKKAINTVGANLTESVVDKLKVAELHLKNGFEEEGEKLLLTLLVDDRQFLVHQRLASYYLTEDREEDAVKLYKKIVKHGDLGNLSQAIIVIEFHEDSKKAYKLLKERDADYGSQIEYLSLCCEIATRASLYEDAVPLSLELVRRAQGYGAINNSVKNAVLVISKANKLDVILERIEEDQRVSMLCLKAWIWLEKKDIKKAEEVLRPELEEKNQIITYTWVGILQREKLFEKAVVALKSLDNTVLGKSPTYLKKLSDLQRLAGDMENSLATIEKWKIVASGDQQPWIAEYEIHVKRKRYSDAIASLRKATLRFDDTEVFNDLLAQVYSVVGRADQAFSIYWKSFENALTEQDKGIWITRLVEFAKKHNKFDFLEQKFLKRSKDNPKSVSMLEALATLYRASENQEKEIQILSKILDFNAEFPDLWMRIAELHEIAGDLDKAELAIQTAVKNDTSGDTRSQLVQFYLRIGESEKALDQVQKMLGKGSPREIELLALQLYFQDYWAEAEGVLKFAIVKYPDDGRLNYLLGSVLEDLRKYEEAVKYFTRVYTSIPQPSQKVVSAVVGTTLNSPHIKPHGYRTINGSRGPWSGIAGGHTNNDGLRWRAYERFFTKNNASSRSGYHHSQIIGMNIPGEHKQLLEYVDQHLAMLSTLVKEKKIIFSTLKSRGIEDVNLYNNILDEYSNRIRFNVSYGSGSIIGRGQELKDLIHRNPRNILCYQIAKLINYQEVSADTHDYILSTVSDLELQQHAARLLMIQESTEEQYARALNFYRKQFKQGILAHEFDWIAVYTSMISNNSIRTPEQIKQVKDLTIQAIEHYCKQGVNLLDLPIMTTLMFTLEDVDIAKKLFSVNKIHHKQHVINNAGGIQHATLPNLSWNVNRENDYLKLLQQDSTQVFVVDNWYTKQGYYNYFWVTQSGFRPEFVEYQKELVEQLPDVVSKVSLLYSHGKIQEATALIKDAIADDQANRKELVQLQMYLLFDSGMFEEIVKNAEQYITAFSDEPTLLIENKFIYLAACLRVAKEFRKQHQEVFESTLVDIIKLTNKYGFTQQCTQYYTQHYTQHYSQYYNQYSQQVVQQYVQQAVQQSVEQVSTVFKGLISEVSKNTAESINKEVSKFAQAAVVSAHSYQFTSSVKNPNTTKIKNAQHLLHLAKNKPRYERIKDYIKAGKEDAAIKLSVRLLMRTLSKSNFDASMHKKIIAAIDNSGIRGQVNHAMQSWDCKSENEADLMLVYIYKLEGKNGALKYIKQDSYLSQKSKDLVKNLLTNDDKEFSQSLLNDTSTRNLPLMVQRSHELFDKYLKRQALAFVSDDLSDKSLSYVQKGLAIANYLLEGKRFPDGVIFNPIYLDVNNDSEEIKDRISLLKQMVSHLFKSRHGANQAYAIATKLKGYKIEVEGDAKDWALAVIRSGVLELDIRDNIRVGATIGGNSWTSWAGTSPRVITTNRFDLSFQDALCIVLRDDVEILSEVYLSSIKEKMPVTAEVLKEIADLKLLEGETFRKRIEQTRLDWNAKNNPTLNLIGGNLNKLKVYNQKKFSLAINAVIENFSKDENVSNIYGLRSNITQIFARAFLDIAPEDIAKIYIETYFLVDEVIDEKFKEHDKKVRKNQLLNIFREVDSYIARDARCTSEVYKLAWREDVILANLQREVTQLFRSNRIQKAEDLVDWLESHGLLEPTENYTPMVYYSQSSSLTLNNLFSDIRLGSILSNKEREEAVKLINARGRETIGAGIVKMYLLNDKDSVGVRKKLIEKYAPELMKLDDAHFERVFSVLNFDFSLIVIPEDQKHFLAVIQRSKKLSLKRVDAAATKWKSEIDRDIHWQSHATWKLWKNSGNKIVLAYQALDSQKALEFARMLNKLDDELLGILNEQKSKIFYNNRSYANSKKSFIKNMIDDTIKCPLEAAIERGEMLMAHKIIREGEGAGYFLKRYIINKISEHISKYRTTIGATRFGDLTKIENWEGFELDIGALGSVQPKNQKIIIHHLIGKYLGDNSFFELDRDMEPMKSWINNDESTDLKKAIKVIAALKCKQIVENREDRMTFLELFKDVAKTSQMTDELLSEVTAALINNYTWARGEILLFEEKYAIDSRSMDFHRAKENTTASFISTLSKSEDEKIKNIGTKYIKLWHETLAQDPALIQQSNFSRFIRVEMFDLAMMSQNVDAMNFIIDHCEKSWTRPKMIKRVREEISREVAKGVRSDKFQNYLDQFDANIKKKELKEYEALVLKIKDWNIDYTSIDEYRKLKADVGIGFKALVKNHPSKAIELLVLHQESCDKFAARDPKLWGESRQYFNEAQEYCSSEKIVKNNWSFLGKDKADKIQFFADFLSEKKIRKSSHFIDVILDHLLSDHSRISSSLKARDKNDRKEGELLIEYIGDRNDEFIELFNAILLLKVSEDKARGIEINGDEIKRWKSKADRTSSYQILASTYALDARVPNIQQDEIVESLFGLMSNKYLTTTRKIKIARNLYNKRGWFHKREDVEKWFMELLLAELKEGKNALGEGVKKQFKMFATFRGFEKKFAERYIDEWFVNASKQFKPGSQMDSELASEVLNYATLYKKEDIVRWLLANCNKSLRLKLSNVVNLIEFGYFDKAKQLVPRESEVWENSSLYHNELLEKNINQLWEKWSHDPWACLMVVVHTLDESKFNDATTALERATKVYDTLMKLEIHALAKHKILRVLYQDHFFMKVDREYMKQYTKGFSKKELKDHSFTKLSSEADIKDLYTVILARDSALQGDFEPLKETLDILIRDSKKVRYRLFYREISTLLDSFALSIIAAERKDLMKKYHELILSYENVYKTSDSNLYFIYNHFSFTKLIYDLEEYEQLDVDRAFKVTDATSKSKRNTHLKHLRVDQTLSKLKNFPTWISPENKRRRQVLGAKVISWYEDLDQFNYRQYDLLDKNVKWFWMFPGIPSDYIGIEKFGKLSEEKQMLVKRWGMEYLLSEDKLKEAEPVFIEVTEYYQKNNQKYFQIYSHLYLQKCVELKKIDLLKKHIKGTMFEQQYSDLKVAESTKIDLFKLSEEELIVEFKKLEKDENGFPHVEAISELLLSSNDFSGGLLYYSKNRVNELTEKEKLEHAIGGINASGLLHYTFIIDMDNKLKYNAYKRMVAAFAKYHQDLPVEGGKWVAGKLEVSGW